MTDSSEEFEELPNCPNCETAIVQRTPLAEHDYQCLNCGTEFNEGGRGKIIA